MPQRSAGMQCILRSLGSVSHLRTTFQRTATQRTLMAARHALIGFMAALSQAQAEATKEAHKAGIAHAKAREDKVYLGRKPSFTVAQVTEVISLIGEGKGVTQVAKQLDLSRGAIYRIQKCPADAFASVRASS